MAKYKGIDTVDKAAVVEMLVKRWLAWYEQAQSLVEEIEHKFSPAAIEHHMPDFDRVKTAIKNLRTVPAEYAAFMSGEIPQDIDQSMNADEWVKRLNNRFDEAEKELLHRLGSLEKLSVSLSADPSARAARPKVFSPLGLARNFLVPILAALITSPVTTAVNSLLFASRSPALALRANPAPDSPSLGQYLGSVVIFILVLVLIYVLFYAAVRIFRALRKRRRK